MIGKQVDVRKDALVLRRELVEMPRPLELLSESEIEKKHCISRVMTYVLKHLTDEFASDGFEWLLPVILSQSTDPLWPDQCASIEKRIEVEIYGKTVRTTASMIIHKLVACSIISPKLFSLSPNVRIEKSERGTSGVHAYEFTQLDFEVRNATSRDIRSFVEGIICRLIENLKEDMSEELLNLERYDDLRKPRIPFELYDKAELEKEYGVEWEKSMLVEIDDPVWITNLPREFYDFEDFQSGKWDNYDLLLPQYGEVLSGARREFEFSKINKKMERDNVRKENYRLLLRLAKEGRLKPSAGAGIGIERLVSWITGAKHIGETQLFPKIPGLIYDL
ncbi:MAG: asparagine synthetase A [Candidatus Bathyarchaeia archaeon]|jgi:asparaginyl-tRNA synthetase